MVNFALPIGPSARPGHMVTGFTIFDDFAASSVSAAADQAGIWDFSGSTAGSVPVFAVDEPYGVVTLNPENTTDESVLELNGEPIQFLREQDALFEIRMKVSAITSPTSTWFLGLSQTALDLESGSAGAFDSSGIGFMGIQDANILAICGNGTAETREDTTVDLVADTYVVLTWKWHAKSKQVRYYVDGAKKITQSLADSDKLPADGTNLTITLLCEGHDTGALLDIDYVLFMQDRE